MRSATPAAANVGLLTSLAGGFEVRVIQHAAQTIVGAWTAAPPAQSGGLGEID